MLERENVRRGERENDDPTCEVLNFDQPIIVTRLANSQHETTIYTHPFSLTTSHGELYKKTLCLGQAWRA